MTSSNRVILTGRVARPPERRYRPDGSPVIQFRLELSDREDRAAPSGHGSIHVVAFGTLAEIDLDLFPRGQRLVVEGRLNQRNWRTPEGRHRALTEVIATDIRRIEETNPIMGLSKRGDDHEKTC
jgi:single-strand DNA-binding protein